MSLGYTLEELQTSAPTTKNKTKSPRCDLDIFRFDVCYSVDKMASYWLKHFTVYPDVWHLDTA